MTPEQRNILISYVSQDHINNEKNSLKDVRTFCKKPKVEISVDSLYTINGSIHYHGYMISKHGINDIYECEYFYGVGFDAKTYRNKKLLRHEYYDFDDSRSVSVQYYQSGRISHKRYNFIEPDLYFSMYHRKKEIPSLAKPSLAKPPIINDDDLFLHVNGTNEKYSTYGNINHRATWYQHVNVVELFKNKTIDTIVYNLRNCSVTVDVTSKKVYYPYGNLSSNQIINWSSIEVKDFYYNNKEIFK